MCLNKDELGQSPVADGQQGSGHRLGVLVRIKREGQRVVPDELACVVGVGIQVLLAQTQRQPTLRSVEVVDRHEAVLARAPLVELVGGG